MQLINQHQEDFYILLNAEPSDEDDDLPIGGSGGMQVVFIVA